MWATITKPFAWLMVWLWDLTHNYGLSIILFALAVNLILTPFMWKSKKSMMRQSRVQPKLQELQKRHAGNQQKLNEEMQKLYREEGINPMSGCLWSLIPFPILIALYSVIRQPLQRMMFVDSSVVDALKEYFATAIADLSSRAQAYVEIMLTDLLHNDWAGATAYLTEKGLDISRLIDVNFGFLGLNLGETPDWQMLWGDYWQGGTSVWLPALGLFLIPFISAGLSWVSMKISSASNPSTGGQNDQAAATMKSMNLMMPLMSVWICFIMPAAMGIYWIANSVFGIIRDYILTKIAKKKLDEEDAERIASRSAREKELEEKREETERLRAEGKTEQNVHTSKKKLQAIEAQKLEERKAALQKQERAERRARLGIEEAEKPASQVGNRRYARGRAYVADRFTNPETAEEATLAAAAASEGAAAIDETVADDVATAEAAVVEAAAVVEEAVTEEAPASSENETGEADS